MFQFDSKTIDFKSLDNFASDLGNFKKTERKKKTETRTRSFSGGSNLN